MIKQEHIDQQNYIVGTLEKQKIELEDRIKQEYIKLDLMIQLKDNPVVLKEIVGSLQ